MYKRQGEALAAIAAVSRVDLLTKTAGAVEGVSLHLEAGAITEESEAGCPEGFSCQRIISMYNRITDNLPYCLHWILPT